MGIAAEKIAEVLSWPQEDRASLARQLIASLENAADSDVEQQWREEIDLRSEEIANGKVNCRPVQETVQDIRNKLNARRQSS